jgi:hypothetical protein
MHILLKNLLLESAVTDNPNFKKWFKDSKVVDKQGNPLPVYHGTGAEFSSFKKKNLSGGVSHYLDIGIHFAETSDTAGTYAMAAQFSDKYRAGYSQGGKSGNPMVYPVYLSAQNPLDVDRGSRLPERLFLRMKQEANLSDRTKAVILYKVDPILILQEYQRKLGKDKLQKLLLSEKYDSVKYIWQGTNWVVFEPTQIKSIFNNGEFDPNNPDISK